MPAGRRVRAIFTPLSATTPGRAIPLTAMMMSTRLEYFGEKKEGWLLWDYGEEYFQKEERPKKTVQLSEGSIKELCSCGEKTISAATLQVYQVEASGACRCVMSDGSSFVPALLSRPAGQRLRDLLSWKSCTRVGEDGMDMNCLVTVLSKDCVCASRNPSLCQSLSLIWLLRRLQWHLIQ